MTLNIILKFGKAFDRIYFSCSMGWVGEFLEHPFLEMSSKEVKIGIRVDLDMVKQDWRVTFPDFSSVMDMCVGL